MKAGLFGPSQALKGTDGFGNPEKEYEYASKYLKLSGLKLLWYDLAIIAGACVSYFMQMDYERAINCSMYWDEIDVFRRKDCGVGD